MIKSFNQEECSQLLADNYVGQLAYIYQGRPFILLMTYFFDANKTIICYSDEGQRILAMRKNSAVSLQVLKLKDVDNWSSALAHGTYE